jgi:hypothetical protein
MEIERDRLLELVRRLRRELAELRTHDEVPSDLAAVIERLLTTLGAQSAQH